MNSKKHSKIKYFDLWGLRKDKYKFLETHDIKNTEWQELGPKEPYYWFIFKDLNLEGDYSNFIPLRSIFEKYNAGIATGKDDFLVEYRREALIRKLSIVNKEFFEERMNNYGIDAKMISVWYEELRSIDINSQVRLYSYRPFDNRFTIYNSRVLQRARRNIMDNFLFDNLALAVTKNSKQENFDEVFMTNSLTDKHLTGHQTFVFPLYLYSDKQFVFKGQKHLDISGVQKKLDEGGGRKSNIKSEIIKKLSDAYKKQISAEEIFCYIYGVLYSSAYRKKYNEFLKIDFPRIPFTRNYDLFCKVAELGKELVDLHLLKSKKLDKVIAKFPVSTGNVLTDGQAKQREYNQKEKRVYINDKQYFEGVDSGVWNYHIGGYQVLDKWLKDRIGAKLQPEDINHYLKIITALKHTIDLQKQIDKIYPEAEETLINSNKDRKGQRIRTQNR